MMRDVPSIQIPLWRRLLAKMNIYKLRPAKEATTLVIEVGRDKDGRPFTHINRIQNVPMEDVKLVLENIIRDLK